MLTPIIDPALVEAVGPSLVVGESAPPLPVLGVVVGGTAAEVAGDLAVGVAVGVLTTGVGDEGAAAGGLESGDEGAAAGGLEAETTNKKQIELRT